MTGIDRSPKIRQCDIAPNLVSVKGNHTFEARGDNSGLRIFRKMHKMGSCLFSVEKNNTQSKAICFQGWRQATLVNKALFSVFVKPLQVVACMYALDDSAEDYSELNRGCLSEAVDWLEEKEEAMMWTSVAALVVTAANAAVAVGAGMRAAG